MKTKKIKSDYFKKTVEVPIVQHKMFSLMIAKPTKELNALLKGITNIKVELIPKHEQLTHNYKQEGLVKNAISDFLHAKKNSKYKWGFGGSHCWIKPVDNDALADNHAIIFTEQETGSLHHTNNLYRPKVK